MTTLNRQKKALKREKAIIYIHSELMSLNKGECTLEHFNKQLVKVNKNRDANYLSLKYVRDYDQPNRRGGYRLNEEKPEHRLSNMRTVYNTYYN